jgi:hypothetical protein
MIIILTTKESSSQLVSGIPEYVDFEVNHPATVFYTLDGSVPDESSYMVSGRIYLPSDKTDFTLNAVAVSGSSSSGMFSERYYVIQAPLARSRILSEERVTVLGYDEEVEFSAGFDSSGDDAMQSSKSSESLDIMTSRTDSHGYEIPDGSSHGFINFPEKEAKDVLPHQGDVSTVNSNVDFNPNAGLIIIDGRGSDAFDSQEVRIINRTSGTFGVFGGEWNEHLNNRSLVTGNLVRSLYNPNNNTVVSYYYESRENRWIESIQSVDVSAKKLSPARKEGGGVGIVFRWVDARGLSRLY